jgi:hypothetical protein
MPQTRNGRDLNSPLNHLHMEAALKRIAVGMLILLLGGCVSSGGGASHDWTGATVGVSGGPMTATSPNPLQ